MNPLIRRMRQDWDRRASANPFYFICSQRENWAEEDFWRSGEEDVERYLMPHVHKHGIDPSRSSVLDFGCGIGRLTRALAQRFSRVVACDISPLMIDLSRSALAGFSNIEWIYLKDKLIDNVDSESQDVVFSFLVIQHIPKKDISLGYIKEMCRVLKPGGVLCIQFSNINLYPLRVAYNTIRSWLSGFKVGWMLVDKFLNQKRLSRESIQSMLTLMEHSLDPSLVVDLVRKAGLSVEYLDTTNERRIWLVARKPRS